jgi:hypothetical protein
MTPLVKKIARGAISPTRRVMVGGQALVARQWDEEGRPPLLRVEFDRKLRSNENLAKSFDQARHSWG